MQDALTQCWIDEGERVAESLCDHWQHVYGLVDSVELPAELCAHQEAADLDPTHDSTFDEWMQFLSHHDLLLPVEQSCDGDGVILDWGMRAVRLKTLPHDMLARLHLFFDECPRHTRALLTHHVFWLVRFERVTRQGSPTWTATEPSGHRRTSE